MALWIFDLEVIFIKEGRQVCSGLCILYLSVCIHYSQYYILQRRLERGGE